MDALLCDFFKPTLLRHAAIFPAYKTSNVDFVFSVKEPLPYNRAVSCTEIWREFGENGVVITALSLDNNQIYPLSLPINVSLIAAVEALGFEAFYHVIAGYSSGCHTADTVIIDVGKFHVECMLVGDSLRLLVLGRQPISVPLADNEAFESLRSALLRYTHA